MRRPLPAALLALAVTASTTLGAGASAADDARPAPTGLPAVTLPAVTLPAVTLPAGDASGPSAPAGAAGIGRGLATATGTVSAFVELAAPSVLDVTEQGGDGAAVEAATEHIERLAATVVPQAAGGAATDGDPAPERLGVTTTVIAGAVVRGDAARIRDLASAPGVAGVHRIVPKRVGNSASGVLTRTLTAWRSTGGTGEGVRVGVVDTGLDYTHAHFGGPGTAEAYAAAYGTDGTGPVPDGTYDPAKYLGGVDLAGPTYDASGRTPGSTRTPAPDANPIDAPSGDRVVGHGTHVAGTGFGYGVLPDGSTFRGDHDRLTDLSGWRVGPGSAPRAGVYALKVVGDRGGTTELILPALDRAMDPDRDGDVSDHLDVVNLSLGENLLPADDPESLFVDRLARVGVLTVLGAGGTGTEPGDATDTIGAPGNARSGLTVASSIGDARLYDSVEVTAAPDPDAVGLHPAQGSTRYTGTQDVTAPVAFLGDDVTGCAPLTPYADRVAGKVVWLLWDDTEPRDCGSGTRFDHAQAAGAVGVLVGTELPDFPVQLGGGTAIPGAQLTAAATDRLLPLIRTGDVTVRLGPSLRESSFVVDESLQDTLSGDSPRGVHGSLGIVKPDVAAPGAAILSARSGSGTRDRALSGTSMAAPHVAGIAALVLAAHPDWTPAQVKAAVMNTATHDVHLSQDPASPVHGPLRVGSGRVDAADAVRTTTLAYATDDPAQVSVSFGVVPVGAEPVRRRATVTVHNTGDRAVEYRTSVDVATTSGGAALTASPEVLTVEPGERGLVTLTLDADPATLRKDLDPTSERFVPLGAAAVPRDFVTAVSGRLVLRSADAELRVPVVAAPRPVSDLTAEPVAFDAAGVATADLRLTGRGVDGGGWTSLVAPLQLVATSPRLPAPPTGTSPSAVASGDLRAVGFASTAPQPAAVGAEAPPALIGIGIAVHGSWARLGATVFPQVDTDVDGDGVADFRTVVGKHPAGDLTVARTFPADPADGTWAWDEPVNSVTGDTDTTVFDSDVVVVPIPVAALGLSAGMTPTMTVSTWSGYAPDGSGRIDTAGPFTVDPFTPQYWFDGGTPGSLVFRAAPGTPVTVHRQAAPGAPAPPLLVLHLHNATTATRAQVVEATAPAATPTTTTLAVSGTPAVGSPLTLTATVTPAAATGTVDFRAADGTVLATAPVEDGAATATLTPGGGEHRVTARFEPADGRWAASASEPASVVVPRAASTLDVRLSDRAIAFGDLTTATVRVTAAAGAPAGTVELRAGGSVIALAAVEVDGSTGTARVDLPRDLPVGGHRITATYTGSTDVAGSDGSVRLRIVPAAPQLAVTAPSWTVPPGTGSSLTVSVTGRPGAPAPTGRVTVLLNLRRVAGADLGPGGRVTVTLPAARRDGVVTVLYGGDQGYRPDLHVRVLRVR